MSLSDAVSDVYVIVPDGIDDPARPSGGNTYDRQVCRGLAAAGWTVHEHRAPGYWPHPDAAAKRALTRIVGTIPDGAVVLIDGLIASSASSVLVPEARRLRLVILVHMLLGDGRSGGDAADTERAVLSAASAVIATSRWTRAQLLDRYGLRAEQVHVSEPGVDPAAPAPGTAEGGQLLSVAAVLPHKGHDEVFAALARIPDLPWHYTCVGSLALDPAFVSRLRRRAEIDGIGARVCLTDPRTGDELDRTYHEADVLVLASHAETYGLVVTEALAYGLPVIATAVGGLADALGRTGDGRRPGLLVPPGDTDALASALRSWLQDSALRRRLRLAAAERRRTLTGWHTTTNRIARVLTRVMTR